MADYPTKAYVTPRGTYKTWMTRNLDWDGGDGIGVYKLGCPLVFSATNKDTGGYNSKTDPTYSYRNTAVRNPAWDDTGNGGELEPDAAITALGGRHYTFYEYLTGAPRGGLMEEYYSEWPAPYTVGREVRDAADYTILFEGLTSAKLQEYAGREEEFFEEHPVSRIQIQGICPYGWHVANFQDWYDILYAAYDFGSKNNGGYVPRSRRSPIRSTAVRRPPTRSMWCPICAFLGRCGRSAASACGTRRAVSIPSTKVRRRRARLRPISRTTPRSSASIWRLRGGGRCRWDGRIWG